MTTPINPPDESSSPPSPQISYPTNRPQTSTTWTPSLDASLRAQQPPIPTPQTSNLKKPPLPRAFWPGGDRSLAGIALRAFLLGTTTSLGLLLTILLAYTGSPLWRPTFFLLTLSIFHFLEFYTTAAYNTPSAFVSSFLLTNGARYRQAHMVAFIETTVTTLLFPKWQARVNPPSVVALGLVMIVVGQAVRSFAMVQAGTNFNHMVQSKKNEGHELVTDGLYAYFRHPSYFGFFWWGLGTQVALGNAVSLVGYAGVLWYFFATRIRHEEKHLIQFFGDDYKAYRARTRVWIPFI